VEKVGGTISGDDMQVSLGFFVSLAIDKCYGSANYLTFMQKAVNKRFLTLNTLRPWK